ncbi:thioredoxin-2 [Drosophila persimilis]|uniref:Thioredoxin n=1 Tax=Drosophila pseudoobscura pseudoobscura TaxID=46245 RepID=Q29NA8_DROPS|nr:thioredoxin-2 [Drosophila pseudoobscura]XP_026844882.1 thioredoxin-2 [Drosophila persimilis]
MVYQVKDKADLDAQLQQAGSKLVVLDFYATWCGPCKMIAPKLAELATQYADNIVILKVDVDESEDIAMDYNICSMPTFVFIKNTNKVEEFAGANAQRLEDVIKANI